MIIHQSGDYNLTATVKPLTVDIIQLNGEDISVVITLNKPGTSAIIRAITLGQNDQQGKLQITLRHLTPNTTASFNGRALLRQKSHLEFRGLIEIDDGCSDTESFLTHRTILQDGASVNPVPSLEIRNNQVKASHAVAVTQLDEEARFFLRSRGLSEQTADSLLITAFLADITDQIAPLWQKRIAQIIR